MSKRLSSRNPKSRGLKAKYVVQICLLLGVCCWLIYQIKHSHAKKKEFDETVMKEKLSRDDDMFLGRKGLIRTVPKIDNHVEDEESEDDGSEANEREDLKMEQEKEEAEMRDREGAHGGKERVDHEDDETEDDNKVEEEVEQETKEEDNAEKGTEESKNDDGGNAEHDDVEERETVGGDNHNEEVKDDGDVDEDRMESDPLVEDHEQDGDGDKDLDGGDEESHEAREENYKADDASSAVAHESLEESEDKEGTQKQYNSTERNPQVLDSNHNATSSSFAGESLKLDAILHNETSSETNQLGFSVNSFESLTTNNSTSTESDDGAEENSQVEDLPDSSHSVELGTLPDITSNGVNDRNGATE